MANSDHFADRLTPGVSYSYEDLFYPYYHSHDILSEVVKFNLDLCLIMSSVYLDTHKGYQSDMTIFSNISDNFWAKIAKLLKDLGINVPWDFADSKTMELYIRREIDKLLRLRKYETLGLFFREYYIYLKTCYNELLTFMTPRLEGC